MKEKKKYYNLRENIQNKFIRFWRNPISLTFAVAMFVFIIMMVTAVLMGLVLFALYKLQIVTFGDYNHFVMAIILMMIISIVTGTVLVALFVNKLLKPIRILKKATREIASGNFDIHVKVQGMPELAELTEDFNMMAQELKSVETLRNDFINNFSHEFKTPIVSIQGFAKLLKKDNLGQSQRDEYLDIIIDESNRLVKLSHNVLTLSKLEQQNIITEKTSFLLDEQIRRAILLLEPEWQKKQIRFCVEMDKTKFCGNEEILQQVWLNLIGNAIKFTGQNGLVSVILRCIKEEIVIEIIDDGIGMDEETIKHIFDKFYQGDKAHATQGNGLGLPLVKRIIDMYGGEISVSSEPGHGSKFSLRLPLA
jgi:signal transduction histidine kinase